MSMNKSAAIIYLTDGKSPRSKLLPGVLGASTLVLGDLSGPLAWRALLIRQNVDRIADIKRSVCWLEYTGNPFYVMRLAVRLLMNKNTVVLDCHNSALELEQGKLLKYVFNVLFLYLCAAVNVNLVRHNSTIRIFGLTFTTLYTPYPDFSEYAEQFENDKRERDVIFLCSLNDDEPVDLIINTCRELAALGLTAKITGNPERIRHPLKSSFFFEEYLSYEDYLREVARSKLAVSLTIRESTLLFAPREAVSLGVPCLINDSKTNREFYGSKCHYTELEEERLQGCILRQLNMGC